MRNSVVAVITVVAIILLVLAATVILLPPSSPQKSNSSSNSKPSGTCLEDIRDGAKIGNYYNSTSQGYTITYPNGTRVDIPLNSCPVPVYSQAYEVDSIIEANPRFIAAENGSAYVLADNSCNCSTSAGSSNSTGQYAELSFVLYGTQKLYPCGPGYWVYNQVGLIIVTIPINATGGLQYSHAEFQSGPGNNFYPCTTTTGLSTATQSS